MILNNTPDNEAILSNVASTGEFRIRNSSKAFSILSSGLYANKIRAIIRELSCNAYDSHVAAGKADLPFDVHLPTSFEPHFSIRDYGVGLTDDEVVNIYTTYFESTKTESNAFVGALGLGSKSPFSYTDNFTVTAVKNGVKNIYSAFINNDGVPSIAKMHTEESTEPTGVEVKFAVENNRDNSKFESEAYSVYTYFKTKPLLSGSMKTDQIPVVVYDHENIIPGVHLRKGRYGNFGAQAIMGNICYPINVPEGMLNRAQQHLLQNHTLDFHFEIGELDFQASREGLSYIAMTVESIRKKADAVLAALSQIIDNEASLLTNQWERAKFLHKKSRQPLFYTAVELYTSAHPFPKNIDERMCIIISENDLAKKFNIVLRGFTKNGSGLERLYSYSQWKNGSYENGFQFQMVSNYSFVIQDTNIGAYERARYHWKNANEEDSIVYVVAPDDRTKPMKTARFFAWLHSPTDIRNASDLIEKPRKANNAASVPIMSLDGTWQSVGNLDSFDENETYYYLPLRNYTPLSEKIGDAKDFYDNLRATKLPEFKNLKLYGVRVSGMKVIEEFDNWVNIEELVVEVLGGLTDEQFLAMAARNGREYRSYRNYSQIHHNLGESNEIRKFVELVNAHQGTELDSYRITGLLRDYHVEKHEEFAKKLDEISEMNNNISSKYPLLSSLDIRYVEIDHVIDYINLVDAR
jgi:hypothetical protein